MQVGLATESLPGSQAFQDVSYGFAIFSIVLPLFGAVVILLLLLGFLVNNTIVSFVYWRGVFHKAGGRGGSDGRNPG
jgi:hypothetical protein